MHADRMHASDEYQYHARISEETAQQILIAFGISGPSPEYERWLRDDGFRPIDLIDVLRPSQRYHRHRLARRAGGFPRRSHTRDRLTRDRGVVRRHRR